MICRCIERLRIGVYYYVGAARAEGIGSTGVDMGGVKELEHPDEVRTVCLQWETTDSLLV